MRVAQVGLDAALVKQAPPLWAAFQSIDASAEKDGQATSSPITVRPTTENGFHFEAGNAGTTGGSEPTWPATEGGTVVDNGITWTAIIPVDGEVSAEMEIQEEAQSCSLQVDPVELRATSRSSSPARSHSCVLYPLRRLISAIPMGSI